jgi:hypothetical protein
MVIYIHTANIHTYGQNCNYKSTYRNVLRHTLLEESEFYVKNLIWPAGPYRVCGSKEFKERFAA